MVDPRAHDDIIIISHSWLVRELFCDFIHDQQYCNRIVSDIHANITVSDHQEYQE